MWTARPIERVGRIAPQVFLREIVPARRPVVFSWRGPAWSPESLRDRFGSLPVQAYVMREGRIVLDPRTGFRLAHMTMREYVDRTLARDEPSLYLRARMPTLPALDRELATPAHAGRLALRRNLWFAAKGTVSQLHFDLPHNLVAQLHGRKKFYVFHSSDPVYPHAWRSSTPHLSRVDPEAPDLARFPRLASARPLETELEPGDVLFLPQRFWHHARALTTSVSVNFWWCEPATFPLLMASDLYKRLRGLHI